MFKTVSVLFVSLFLVWGVCLASGDGGYAGAFLQTGAGARPLGMGNTFTAVCNDVTALFYNPAGLAQLGKKQLSTTYSEMFEGRKQAVLGFACPSKLGNFGFGWLHYGVSGISKRDNKGQPQGEFGDSENAFLLSYAKGIGSPLGLLKLMFGANLKGIYHKLDTNAGTGYGADIGILTRGKVSGIMDIGMGVSIQNLSTSITWDTESEHRDDVPVNIRGGLSFGLAVIPVDLTFDVEKNMKQDLAFHLGLEYWFLKLLGLRAGSDRGNITAGISLRLPLSILNPNLDYGFSTDPVSANGIHRVSMTASF